MKSLPRSTPVFYPVAERMPDSRSHQRTRNELVETVSRHLATRGVRAFTSSDQFLYWVEGDPKTSAAPDLYVVVGAAPDLMPRNWKTWEDGVPELVIEVVSKLRKKDYDVGPRRYDQAGVHELVVFDPYEMRTRVRWQLFRREGGQLRRLEAHDGDRVWSQVLEAWLVLGRFSDGTATVRVATGDDAEHWVPTNQEVADRAEAALADKEAEVEALRRRLQELGADASDG